MAPADSTCDWVLPVRRDTKWPCDRLSRGRDLREYGSGKTGATNILRVVGKRAAALWCWCSIWPREPFPCIMARLIPWPDDTWLGIAMGTAAAAAVVGHIWSIWIRPLTGKWGGGRGVATVLGATLVVYPLAAVIAMLVGIVVIAGVALRVAGLDHRHRRRASWWWSCSRCSSKYLLRFSLWASPAG